MATSPASKNAKRQTPRIGSVKMQKEKGFSFRPWQALVAVLFVVVAGYAIVRFSQAGTNRSFETKITDPPLQSKADGVSYSLMNIDPGGFATRVSKPSLADLLKSQQVCAHLKFISGTTAPGSVDIKISNEFGGSNSGAIPSLQLQASSYPLNSTKTVCTPIRLSNAETLIPSNTFSQVSLVVKNTGTTSVSVGVDVIYGDAVLEGGKGSVLFTHGADKIDGGTLGTKSNGVRYKLGNASWAKGVPPAPDSRQDFNLSTTVTAAELKGVGTICASYKFTKQFQGVILLASQGDNPPYDRLSGFATYPEGFTQEVCSPNNLPSSTDRVLKLSFQGNGSVAVEKIYGLSLGQPTEQSN